MAIPIPDTMGKEIADLKNNRTFTDGNKYKEAHNDWKNKRGDYSKFEFSGDTSHPIYVFGWNHWDYTNAGKDVAHLRKSSNVVYKDRRSEQNYEKVAYSWGWHGDEGHAWSTVYFDGDYTYNRDEYVYDEQKTVSSLINSKPSTDFYKNGVTDPSRSRKGSQHREWVCSKPQHVIDREKQDYRDAEPLLNRDDYCRNKDTVTNELCKDWCKSKDNKDICDEPMQQYCAANTSDTDYCGCFNFDEITTKVMSAASSKGISLKPECNVLKCMQTSYQTANMQNQTACPSVQLCIQSIDIGKTDQADFKGVTFNCDQESTSTTQVSKSGPSKSTGDSSSGLEQDDAEQESPKILGLEPTVVYIAGAVSGCCCIVLMIILFFLLRS
jgi:hypothetical protein